MLNASQLDRIITVHPVIIGEDHVETWPDTFTLHAQVIPSKGGSFWAAGLGTDDAPNMTFRVRWRDDLTTAYFIEYRRIMYAINQLMEIGRREGIDIICTSQATGAHNA